VGLALGGGAALGWAHLGVFRAIREAGIEPGVISGTSMGAVIGALIAAGRFDHAYGEIMKADLPRVVGLLAPGLPGNGLVDGSRVHRLLRAWFGLSDIEDLDISFCAVATDLTTGNEVLMHSGSVVSALRASISIPGVFAPWSRDGVWLVDGGLVDPVPCGPARYLGAEFVIGVDLNRSLPRPVRHHGSSRRLKHGRLQSVAAAGDEEERGGDPEPSLLSVLVNSLLIGHSVLSTLRSAVDPPDLLISPDLSSFAGTEFHRAPDLEAAGYEAAKPALALLAGKL